MNKRRKPRPIKILYRGQEIVLNSDLLDSKEVDRVIKQLKLFRDWCKQRETKG